MQYNLITVIIIIKLIIIIINNTYDNSVYLIYIAHMILLVYGMGYHN